MKPSTTSHRTLQDESGAALVEFALVLPLLLFLALGMMDLGKVFNYWNDANHIAAEGARFAAVNRDPSDPSSSTALASYIQSQADTAELKNGGTDQMPAGAQVCITFPNGTSEVGDPVKVTVTADYGLLPLVAEDLQIATVPITGSATMRIEVPPDFGEHCS